MLFALAISTALTVQAASAAGKEMRLAYGSFSDPENARRYANQLSVQLGKPIVVFRSERQASSESTAPYRVVGPAGSQEELQRWRLEANALDLEPWRLILDIDTPAEPVGSPPAVVVADATPATETPLAPTPDKVVASIPSVATISGPASDSEPVTPPRFDDLNFDLDIGMQGRLFAQRGSNTSDQAQQSLSAQFSANTQFSGGENFLALELFGRWDSDDAQRSHFDLRELTLTHIADRWQLQAGVGQVFWGVVEFNHLIDVVNQTDLVENPDGEDKLGQPMVTFTALPDWGSVELFVLPGFRTRTLPGIAGRLTTALPIDRGEAEFESGAGKQRVDGLLRVSTVLAGVLLDVYHFNGTRRTPRFEVRSRQVGSNSELFLVPNYDTVKQTAVAAQANAGDTAFKLEALQQDGGPESYWAMALGIEHTFVGLFGSSTDLGAVFEYNYDSRLGAAFDTFFESDLALGARFALNDINDSQALFGVVWDTRSQEWVVQLEASRRLSDRWSLTFESRWFMGGDALGRDASIADLLNTNNKLGAVQRDDYLQFEFTRFF